jgi:arabinofuranosyltransferase
VISSTCNSRNPRGHGIQKLLQNRRLDKTLILILAILYVIWGLAFIYRSSYVALDRRRYFSLFDDAMISMRYAWNFSHGFGLVWNPGERVEGYTNLLMVLVMSFATTFFPKREAVLLIQLTGIPWMLGTAWLSMRIADLTAAGGEPGRLLRVLSFAAPLAYYPLSYWSLMGMETGLLTFLLALGVFLALLYLKRQDPHYLIGASLVLGMAYLTRNDSLIFAVLVYLFLLSQILGPGQRIPTAFLAGLAIYALFALGQAAFRYGYYADWLPNTYSLKLVGIPLYERLKNGLRFIKSFFFETGLLLLVVVIASFFRPRKEKFYLVSFVFIAIAYQIYVGGEPWDYWRIMSPTMSFLLIAFIQYVLEISAALIARWGPSARTAAAILTIMVVGFIPVNFRFSREILLVDSPYQSRDNWKNIDIALAINAVTAPDATLGLFWAGTIPYYADRKAIDFLGKSDRHIASLPPDLSATPRWDGMTSVPGHNKYDLNYSIKTLRPTFVQGFKWGSQDLSDWAKEYYVSVKYKGVWLNLLKDSPSVYWARVKSVNR